MAPPLLRSFSALSPLLLLKSTGLLARWGDEMAFLFFLSRVRDAIDLSGCSTSILSASLLLENAGIHSRGKWRIRGDSK